MQNEGIINYLVIFDKPGRKFSSEEDSSWGGLLEPGPAENPGKIRSGMRVALFGSWDFGYLVLETLKKFENLYPGKINIVGLVTDDTVNPAAKISLKKRVWNLLDKPSRVIDETFIIEAALNHGIPVYLGDVKVNSFHSLMKKWDPDVILVCVFGQIIDTFTATYPSYGSYNFHPSDLSQHQGAGPSPYDDLVLRHPETSRWSVHHLSQVLDTGKVIGKSPKVCVVDKNGTIPGNPLTVYHKFAEILSPLAFLLIEKLSENYESHKPGWIDSIDFEDKIPDKVKNNLLQPVTQDPWTNVLSIPDDFLYKPD